MKSTHFTESTTSGSVATVATPVGKTQTRGKGIYPNEKGGNLLTGKKTNKKFPNTVKESQQQGVAEARVKQLPTGAADYSEYDTDFLKAMLRPGILHRDEAKFKVLIRRELKKREQQSQQDVAEGSEETKVGIEAYGVRGVNSNKWKKTFKSQEAFEKWLDQNEGNVEVSGTREVNLNDMFKESMKEAKLDEEDVIIVPGQGNRHKPGFIPKNKDRTDHEVEMAKSDLFQANKNAKKIYELIKDIPETVGIEGWVQEKIIKANDYLNTVREYLEHKQMSEMTVGVIAGGGVGEGSSYKSDYFRRREREEAIISGQKPARKRAPAQTSDYAKRREQEKKVEQGVAEGSRIPTLKHLMKKYGQPLPRDTYEVVTDFIDDDKGIAEPVYYIDYNGESVFGPYRNASSADRKLRQLAMAGYQVGESAEQGMAEGEENKSSAYQAGFSDGKKGSSDPRASSKYGSSSNDYTAGYRDGLKYEEQARKDRSEKYRANIAPYVKMSDDELTQLHDKLTQRYNEILAASKKGMATPAMEQEFKELYDMFQTIHQAKFQKMKQQQGMTEGYRILPSIDREKYQERQGLEGPFRARNGKVYYYDPKAGLAYDPDTDFYIDYDTLTMMDREMSEGADDTKKKISKYEELALAANRAGDDEKCKLYQRKIQALKQKMTQNVDEGIVGKVLGGAALLAALWGIGQNEANKAYSNSPQLQTLIKYHQMATQQNDQAKIQELERRIENHKTRLSLGKGEVMGSDDKPIVPSFESSIMKGIQNEQNNDWGSMSKREFKRREMEHELGDEIKQDRQTWYIRINGKILKDKQKQPYTFNNKQAANKAALTMMSKPFNAGKKFTLTTSMMDAPDTGMNETNHQHAISEKKCPECGGKLVAESELNEEGNKDACYHKVKSRYKVWPSAYASGALVKCRKVGASNWGNKKK